MSEQPIVALVTGCAGDVGQTLCRELADRGFLVVGWDKAPRNADVPVVHWEQLDLTEEVRSAAGAEAIARTGELRYVFHVVGGSDAEELAQLDPVHVPLSAFQRTIAVNLSSAYIVISATVDLMRPAAGDRSFTLVSSINALGGYRAPGYSAAKAGLHGLTVALAPVLGAEGIRINTVALGTTRTANYAHLAAQLGRSVDWERLGTRIPRGSVLSPREAALALMSVGLDNPAISGEIIIADAAQHLLRR